MTLQLDRQFLMDPYGPQTQRVQDNSSTSFEKPIDRGIEHPRTWRRMQRSTPAYASSLYIGSGSVREDNAHDPQARDMCNAVPHREQYSD